METKLYTLQPYFLSSQNPLYTDNQNGWPLFNFGVLRDGSDLSKCWGEITSLFLMMGLLFVNSSGDLNLDKSLLRDGTWIYVQKGELELYAGSKGVRNGGRKTFAANIDGIPKEIVFWSLLQPPYSSPLTLCLKLCKLLHLLSPRLMPPSLAGPHYRIHFLVSASSLHTFFCFTVWLPLWTNLLKKYLWIISAHTQSAPHLKR